MANATQAPAAEKTNLPNNPVKNNPTAQDDHSSSKSEKGGCGC